MIPHHCPICGDEPFHPFMRGQIQRSSRALLSWPPFRERPPAAVICAGCKAIVGWEWPPRAHRTDPTRTAAP